MPAMIFIPLPGVTGPVDPVHLHAALTGMLLPGHDDTDKSYAIHPAEQRGGCWGVRVGVVDEQTLGKLVFRARRVGQLRIGHLTTAIGEPVVEEQVSWNRILSSRRTAWRVTFLTDSVFRPKVAGKTRHSPSPEPRLLLSAPQRAWPSTIPLPPLPGGPGRAVWIEDFDFRSRTRVQPLSQKDDPQPQQFQALYDSWAVYRCDRNVSAAVAPLFCLARFTGVGSYREKGMGVVDVTSLSAPMTSALPKTGLAFVED